MVDRGLEELWTEVHNIAQGAVTKTIPKKRKCKEAKWLSEEALQIAEEREVKVKGERERYTQQNAEFQRRARRDKKAFLSEQREKNRMEKLEISSRKLEGIFHVRMCMIKNRKGKDLTEPKRLRTDGKNTQKNYTKKLLMTWITMMV